MDKAEKIASAKESIMAAVQMEYKIKPQNSYLEALIESRLDLLYEEGKTAGIMVMLGKKDLNEANN